MIKHILNAGVLARYLRFLPGTYYGGVCLRAELFGVKQKPGDYNYLYSGFCSIKPSEVFLLPLRMDASLSQGYPQHKH